MPRLGDPFPATSGAFPRPRGCTRTPLCRILEASVAMPRYHAVVLLLYNASRYYACAMNRKVMISIPWSSRSIASTGRENDERGGMQ
jgi:hypothetical protein